VKQEHVERQKTNVQKSRSYTFTDLEWKPITVPFDLLEKFEWDVISESCPFYNQVYEIFLAKVC
jgi:hypothetical protein